MNNPNLTLFFFWFPCNITDRIDKESRKKEINESRPPLHIFLGGGFTFSSSLAIYICLIWHGDFFKRLPLKYLKRFFFGIRSCFLQNGLRIIFSVLPKLRSHWPYPLSLLHLLVSNTHLLVFNKTQSLCLIAVSVLREHLHLVVSDPLPLRNAKF